MPWLDGFFIKFGHKIWFVKIWFAKIWSKFGQNLVEIWLKSGSTKNVAKNVQKGDRTNVRM